jgi:hypothetical protein
VKPCIPPRATPRDRRSYHYPPAPYECPRCSAWPFKPDDGCGYCGLGRAYPVPKGLDPICDIARGWASAWPNSDPPTVEQEQEFVAQHGPRCARCHRYRQPWHRAIAWLRNRIRAMVLT